MPDLVCECPAAGYCERRKTRVAALHWRKCQAGHVAHIDDHYRRLAADHTHTPTVRRKVAEIPPDVSTIGTQILRAIESATGLQITCGECRRYILGLNNIAYHNHADIVDTLYRIGIPIPKRVHEQHKGRERLSQWISGVIESIVPKPADIRVTNDKPDATQFVWVYWHGGANGDEIRWSVRSVEQWFHGIERCLIVGDRPPWYTGEVIDCPRIPQAAGQKTYRPGLRDVINKMHAIIQSPLVADEFVWMMDDIYFLRPFSLDDLRTPRGSLWREDASNAWQRVKTDTMRRLAKQGLPQYDYATHLPHVVEKDKLKTVLSDYSTDTIWENVYGNKYRASPVPVSPFLCRLQMRMSVPQIRQRIEHATVLNNDVGAWCPALRKVLSEILPRPASVETGKAATVPHIMIIQASYADPELSRRRLEIARHTSVPSLAFQTIKPVIHIATHPHDPHYRERIDLYQSTGCDVRVLDRPQWQLYGENWELPEGRKIVSRMDDDDVLCKEFCERIQAESPEAGECALIWPNGYVFWRENIYWLSHMGNQFVSLITDGMHDPHQEQHWGYHKTWPHKIVSHNVGWIWVRHGDAATSTLPRYRKHHRQAIDSKRIPINLRAILRAIEASGTPSADYTEHSKMRETLQHVLTENAAHAP